MTEYIEKSAILSKCEEMWNNADETTQTGVDTINTLDRITDYIESLPAADVQPVKHGKWIYVGSVRSWDEIKCSACNSAFSTEDRDLILNWDFCPHCGARMDLKDGDAE